jgi:hypothetical protein
MAINTTIAAFLLLTLSTFNAVIELALIFFRDGEPLNSSEEATALFLLSAIVTMTMEELKVEYQENVIFDPTTTILNERTFIEACNRVLGVALRYFALMSIDRRGRAWRRIRLLWPLLKSRVSDLCDYEAKGRSAIATNA